MTAQCVAKEISFIGIKNIARIKFSIRWILANKLRPIKDYPLDLANAILLNNLNNINEKPRVIQSRVLAIP